MNEVPDRSAPVVAVGGVVIAGDVTGPTVLLIRRGKPPRLGGWSLPGGRVERGERLLTAVRREVAEETGLVVRPGPLIEVVELIDDAHHYVVLDYLCEIEGGTLRAGDDATDAMFVAISSLSSVGVTDAVRRVVASALATRT